MTQEDKDLLLKDLSARLPYGVKVKTPYNDAILRGIVDRKGVKTTIDYTDIVTDKQTYPIRYIQPYLRPMSSMTEEEKEELKSLYDAENVTNESICFLEGGTLEEYEAEISFVFCYCVIEWLLKNYFDFMDLIPKNLAIEVTKENNPYESNM